VLVVDDEPHIRRSLRRVLERWGSACHEADGADDAMAIVERDAERLDLVLADVNMPGASGLSLLEQLALRFPELPVVMVTALEDEEVVEEALRLGARGYLLKPVRIPELRGHVADARAWRRSEREARRTQTALEETVRAQATASASMPWALTERLVLVSDLHHGETGAHIRRIGRYASLLAERAGCEPAHAERIGRAALLHDIGKLCIPHGILQKPGALTSDEIAVMRTHAELGARILEGTGVPLLDLARDIALGHHERWNGTGYPRGRKGEETPLEARIVGAVDVFDALGEVRCYKPAWPRERIEAFFEGRRGTEFDPVLVDALLANYDALEAIRAAVPDTSRSGKQA
jgi:putative two-component system response regulator